MAKKKTRKKTTRKKRTQNRASSASSKKTTRKKTTGRRGRPRGGSKLSGASTEQLMAELDRRRDSLQSERDELAERLAEIEGELAGFGGGTATATATAAPSRKRGPGRPRKAGRPAGGKGSGRRGRPRSGNSLADALHALLDGKTMGVSEAADAVKKAGYKTKSANFRTIVNQALIANADRFKKVSRGQYTSK